jgi:MraZ protein
MTNLIGEYELSIDAKGRLLLPAAFRKQLPEGADAQFVVSRGFEQCLNVYTMDEWDTLSGKISKLNDFNPKVREFKRLFLNGANKVETDSAGRLLVPKPLLEHAGITKDAVFASQGNKMELWDKATYVAYMKRTADNFSALAGEVLGGDFMSPFESLT